MIEHEKKRDEELLARAKAWSVTVPRINEYTSKEDMEEIYIEGYTEGQEAAFRKVVELIREVSTQEQDIFSKNDYVRYLLANKEKILGDEC